MKRSAFIFLGILLLTISLSAQYPGQNEGKLKVALAVPVKAYAFDLRDVRLLDGPFKHAMELDQAWLKDLDNDRLMHNFRVNAGLRTNAVAYGGWEALDVELRGHSLGHILSALAMMYASTGDTTWKNKGDRLVAGLAEVQDALGSSGYLSAFPEKYIDRVIAGSPVWAPWYTLHKMFAGLIDMYLLCDNQQALTVVTRMGNWAYNKLNGLTDEQMQNMLRTEFGGMNEALYNLYSITGDTRYKALAEKFYHKKVLDPLLHQVDSLNGLHANTQIPKAIGEARGYELCGTDREHGVSSFFYTTVLKNHTYVIGGNSDGEMFGPPGKLSDRLSDNTTETCNTYNMLKLARHLFCLSADESVADYYERALYNHILASQDPDDGMVCYYVTLRPGGEKAFSDKYNSFWCCVGTGFENHSKYGEAIYYKSSDGGLFVNLFIPSELTWEEKGITLTQKTSFPEEDKSHIYIHSGKPVRAPLYIRYPSWAKQGIRVTVNGKKIKVKEKPGSYIVLNRSWKNIDSIEIELPMSLYTEAMPDNPQRAAILYGPLVLAGELGKKALPDPSFDIPILITGGKPVNEWLKPVAGQALVFRTAGVGKPEDVTLLPFYKIYNQHQIVYWDFLDEAAWQKRLQEHQAKAEAEKAMKERMTDEFLPGDTASESAHHFKSEASESGLFNDRLYRNAHNEGWFEVHVKVDPSSPMEMLCTTWGGDGKPNFEVYVDGKILSKECPNAVPGRFMNNIWALPESITRGKSILTLRFQAPKNGWMNGVYDLMMLRKLTGLDVWTHNRFTSVMLLSAEY